MQVKYLNHIIIITCFLSVFSSDIQGSGQNPVKRELSEVQQFYRAVQDLYISSLKDVLPLDSISQIQTLFYLFSQTESFEGKEKYSENLEVLKELNILAGDEGGRGQSLISKIDRTQTVSGKASLIHALIHPTVSIDYLKKRQDVIKELVENKPLFEELVALISTIKMHEQDLLYFLGNEYTSMQHLYFKMRLFKALNNNPVGMEIVNRLNIIFNPSSEMNFAYGLGLVLLGISGKKIINQGFLSTFLERLKDVGSLYFDPRDPRNWGHFGKTFEDPNEIAFSFNNDEAMWSQSSAWHESLSGKKDGCFIQGLKWFDSHTQWMNPYVTYPILCLGGVFSVESNYKQFLYKIPNLIKTGWTEQMSAIALMQKRLSGVKILLQSIEKLQLFFKNSSVLHDGIILSNAFYDIGSPTTISKDFADLLKLIQTDTFSQKTGWYCYTGRVLVTYRLMRSMRHSFIDILRAIGDLDMCVSLATLYKEFEEKDLHYTFVDYEQSAQPQLNLQKFWSPLIDDDLSHIVANDVVFGSPVQHTGIILTGSNKNGKSTLMRSIGVNLWLGQTVGLIPAQKASWTPFDAFVVSLHTQDTLANKKSSWEVECERAAQLVKTISSCSADQKAFIAVDELFKSGNTSAEIAEHEALSVATLINDFDNVVCLFATHMKALTQLEATTQGKYKNYKMDAILADGKEVYPHILQEGVSSVSTAEAILSNLLHGAMSA